VIKKPSKSELETIEANLRLYYTNQPNLPRFVRLATATGDANAINAAWKNETVRLWYLCICHGVDPLEMEHHINALIDDIDWETY